VKPGCRILARPRNGQQPPSETSVTKDARPRIFPRGSVINPSTGEKMPRTQFLGGYTVNAKQDGLTEM
jgi:hypothetical protein